MEAGMGLATDAVGESVVLRGGNSGLEVHIDAEVDPVEVALTLAEKLEE